MMHPDSTLENSRLYLCTDARRDRDDFKEFITKAFVGGVDIIQLRDKSLEANQELRYLEILKEVAEHEGKLWAVNDRADLALLSQSPILHVGQDDLSTIQARNILGTRVIVGRSSHSMTESTIENDDSLASYFAVGPCWPTPTKPGRLAPGLDLIRYVARLKPLKPWFAIGGIDLSNVHQVLESGAERIVVVRAITEASDPERAARELRSLL